MTDKDPFEDEDGIPLPPVIPVFPLTGAVLLPFCVLPLNIFEPRYLAMVRDAASGAGVIGMVQPRTPRPDEPDLKAGPHLYGVGGAGKIRRLQETDDGRILIELLGLSRFRIIEELDVTTPYRQVRADWEAFEGDVDPNWDPSVTERSDLLDLLDRYLKHENLDADLSAVEEAPDLVLANSLTMALPLDPTEKQALVEAIDVPARLETLKTLMDMNIRADTSLSGDLN